MLSKNPRDDFFHRVRDYLSMEATIWALDGEGNKGSAVPLSEISPNCFYEMNGDAMLSLSHAVEDLALEEAVGYLAATFPDPERFEPQRERYWQLAATIDQVEVIVCGECKRSGRIKVLAHPGNACKDFWLVLYQGERQQALLIGQQVFDGAVLEERRYQGFLTFSRPVIERVRAELELLLHGKSQDLPEFLRLATLDRAVKQTAQAFGREKATIEKAFANLQVDNAEESIRHFTSHLEKSFARLGQWKEHLCNLATAPQSQTRK